MEVPVLSIDEQITMIPLTLSNNLPYVSLDPSAPSSMSPADLVAINSLTAILLSNTSLVFPPPAVPVVNQLSQLIVKAKEDGNVAFRERNFALAVQHYTHSAELAHMRPLVESNAYARDELAVALANRSAAYSSLALWVEALCDADAVIALKKAWTKGHFRRGKALVGLGRLNEAREAFLFGLQFDPTSQDLIMSTADVEAQIREASPILPVQD